MSTEQTPKPAEQASALWKRLSGRQRMSAIAAVIALLAVLGYMMTRDDTAAHATLFSGLSPEDAGRIVQELQTRKIPYEVDNGGTAITVPEDKVDELRLTLSAEGIAPTGGGVGFELFDKQAFGTTSFVERMNFRRALEGELSRTIMSLTTVERARVHIAMGKRSLYTRDNEPPSASVVLSLRAGQSPSRAQRRGIVNMVASSVDGLEPGRVTLVDGEGNALSSPESDGVGPEGTMDLERTLAQRVERMLESFVGQGNVAVTVTAELDREHVERTEELYDQGPDKTALRSESRVVQGNGAIANVSGPAGARGNLPGTGGAGGGAPSSGNQSLSETKNYEVNRIVQKTVGPKQQIRRLHLAVLVDEPVGEDGTVTPRSEEDLQRIAAIAREAAGLDEERGDRIEVHSVTFAREAIPELPAAEEEATDEAPAEGIPTTYLAAAGAGAALLFLIFFLVLRRRRKHKAEDEAEQEVAATLPMTVGELEAELPDADAHADDEDEENRNKRLDELGNEATALDRAAAVVVADSELAARVLRGWLHERTRTEAAANDSEYDDEKAA